MASIPGLSDFEKLQRKSTQMTASNLTYNYYLSPGFDGEAASFPPTLLFLHGFPDDAQMWSGVVPHMLKLRYRFLMVDILGLGGSDKPLEASDYNWRKQANSIAQILDLEGVKENVIPIGHDWGSAIAQRFYLYHRSRCLGLCFLSLAYLIPSEEPLSLEHANKATTKYFGYPQVEYWNFMTEDDGAALMNSRLDRMYEVMHGVCPSPLPEENRRDIWMREMFCKPNAIRDYLSKSGEYQDYTVPLKRYAQNAALKQRFLDRMSSQGFEAPVNYYHILVHNTMLEDERALCGAPDNADKKIDVPVLYVGQTGDWVCRTDLMDNAQKQGLVSDLEQRTVEAGHWVLYEKPGEIAMILGEWLQRKFPTT